MNNASGDISSMEKASQALQNGQYFLCEKLASDSLRKALIRGDYHQIARIVLPLQEARRQLRLLAINSGRVTIIEELTAAVIDSLQPGCYIIAPPGVGADSRHLIDMAQKAEVPVISFSIEPRTSTGLLPVVAVCSVIIRTKVPLVDYSAINTAWCLEAVEALANDALASLDPDIDIFRRLGELAAMLDALPASEKLHQELADTALQASKTSIHGSVK